MIHEITPKKGVALIKNAFASRNASIATKDAYDLLAQLRGHQSWAVMSAHLRATEKSATKQVSGSKIRQAQVETPSSEQRFAYTLDEVRDWPTWVFAQDPDAESADALMVFPYGTTLESLNKKAARWQFLSDEGAIPFTLGFTAEKNRDYFADLVVATAVGSTYPTVENYGLPMFANPGEVASWLADELGWGGVAIAIGDKLHPNVETMGHCTHDDTLERFWIEARVHPSAHARLLSQFNPRNIDLDFWLNRILVADPAENLENLAGTVQDPRADYLVACCKHFFEDDKLNSPSIAWAVHQLKDAAKNALHKLDQVPHFRLALKPGVLKETQDAASEVEQALNLLTTAIAVAKTHNEKLMQFIIVAPSESDDNPHGDSDGAWSNEQGWGLFAQATRFTAQEAMHMNLPHSAGNDARWVPVSHK